MKRPFGSESHRVGASLREWSRAIEDERHWQTTIHYSFGSLVMLAQLVSCESETRWCERDVSYVFCADIADVEARRFTPRLEAELKRNDGQWRDETRDPSWCPVLHAPWEWRRER